MSRPLFHRSDLMFYTGVELQTATMSFHSIGTFGLHSFNILSSQVPLDFERFR